MGEMRLAAGPETLLVNFEDGLDAMAVVLLKQVAGCVDKGRGIGDDMALRLGWSEYMLKRMPGGELLICERDYSRNPFIDLRQDVTFGVRIMSNMSSVFTRTKVDKPELCAFDSTVRVIPGSLKKPRLVAWRRDAAEGDYSGWCLGLSESGGDDRVFDWKFAYELLGERPEVVNILGMPRGYKVVFEGRRIMAALAGDQAQQKGLLARMFSVGQKPTDHLAKARQLEEDGQPEDALSCYDEAILRAPRSPSMWCRKADTIFFTLHNPEEALRHYKNAIGCGDDAAACAHFGLCMTVLGWPQDGLKSIFKAMKLSSAEDIKMIRAYVDQVMSKKLATNEIMVWVKGLPDAIRPRLLAVEEMRLKRHRPS